jgi:hypothetical protein
LLGEFLLVDSVGSNSLLRLAQDVGQQKRCGDVVSLKGPSVEILRQGTQVLGRDGIGELLAHGGQASRERVALTAPLQAFTHANWLSGSFQ